MILKIAWILCGILAVLLIVSALYITKKEREQNDESDIETSRP